MDRVTHKHVEAACARYNEARGLSYPSVGYLQWADIRGDGSNRRGLYVTVTASGGVGTSYNPRQGKTLRETLANIDSVTPRLHRQPNGLIRAELGLCTDYAYYVGYGLTNAEATADCLAQKES